MTLDALQPYAAAALVLAGFVPLGIKRLLTYLHIFQQEEYDSERFLAWIARTWAIDRRMTLVLLALFALSLAYPAPPILVAAFMAVALAVAALREPDPRRVGKKKLAMTERASRIARIAFLLLAALGLLLLHAAELFLRALIIFELAR